MLEYMLSSLQTLVVLITLGQHLRGNIVFT